jgi:hypothetical protein
MKHFGPILEVTETLLDQSRARSRLYEERVNPGSTSNNYAYALGWATTTLAHILSVIDLTDEQLAKLQQLVEELKQE